MDSFQLTSGTAVRRIALPTVSASSPQQPTLCFEPTRDVFERRFSAPDGTAGVVSASHFKSVIGELEQAGKKIVESLGAVEKREAQFLGAGGNGAVYNLPLAGCENYVVKVPQGFHWDPHCDSLKQIAELPNPFPNLNVGQGVMQIGPLEILQRQEGIAGGVPNAIWQRGKGDPALIRQTLLDHLERTGSLPQAAYDDLARQIRVVNEAGYCFDAGKANNLLINPKTKRFGLVDITDNFDAGKNTIQDVLNRPLLVNHYTLGGRIPAEQLAPMRREILEKWTEAAVKERIAYQPSDLEYLEKAFEGAGIAGKWPAVRDKIRAHCPLFE
jgi:hypothetical protein